VSSTTVFPKQQINAKVHRKLLKNTHYSDEHIFRCSHSGYDCSYWNKHKLNSTHYWLTFS